MGEPNYFDKALKRLDDGEFEPKPATTPATPTETTATGGTDFFTKALQKVDQQNADLKGHAADYAKFLYENTDTVPHETAKDIFRLSRDSGLPMDYVRDNLAEVTKRQDRLKQLYPYSWDALQAKSPALVEYMQNPDNVFLIKDDVQKMSDWEAWVGKIGLNPQIRKTGLLSLPARALVNMGERAIDALSDIEGVSLETDHGYPTGITLERPERRETEARRVVMPISLSPLIVEDPGLLERAWDRGWRQSKFSYRAYGFMRDGKSIPYDQETVDYMMSMTDLGEESRGLGLRIFAGAAETLPMQIQSMVAAGASAKAAGMLTAPLGPEIALPATLIAGGAAAFQTMNMLEGGGAYWQYQQEAGNRGVVFDPKKAADFANGVGVINGLAELLPETVFLAPFTKIPEFKRFFTGIVKNSLDVPEFVAKTTLKDAFPEVSMKRAFLKSAFQMEFAHQTESLVEGGQQIVTDVGQELAIQAMGGPTDTSYITADAVDAYKAAWLAFIPMMLGGSGGLMRHEYNRKRIAQENVTALLSTAAHIQALKTAQTSPDEIAKLAQGMQVEHETPGVVFFQRAKWDEVFKGLEVPIDPRQAARDMTGSDAAYDQAVEHDEDIAIPYAQWAARIAPNPEIVGPLSPMMRLKAGDPYLQEFIDAGKEVEKEVAVPIEEYDAARMQLFETLRDKIPDHKNLSEEQKDEAAVIWTARVKVMADNAGYTDPMQFWVDRNYQLNIKTQAQEMQAEEGEVALAQRAHWDTPEFQRFFEGSKVVDEQGNPLVLYHGTVSTAVFDSFRKSSEGFVWASNKPLQAAVFGERLQGYGGTYGGGLRVLPVYAQMKNPIVIDYDGGIFQGHSQLEDRALAFIKNEGKIDDRERLRDYPGAYTFDYSPGADLYSKLGYDGIILKNVLNYEPGYYAEVAESVGAEVDPIDYESLVSDSYVVFDSKQLKSAIGNKGTYDTTSQSVLYQKRKDAEEKEADSLLHWEPEVTATEKLVGVPEWVNAKKTLALRKKAWRQVEKLFRQFVAEGARARFWYEKSARQVLHFVQGDVVEAEKVCQLLAIFSPQTNVFTNASFALRAYAHWKSGLPRETLRFGRFPTAHSKKAVAVLYDGAPFAGRKTNSFYQNLMHEIWNAATPAEREKLKIPADVMAAIKPPVTVDMWMLHAAGYESIKADDDKGRGRYSTIENLVGKIAAELNDGLPEGAERWIPHQSQASIWSAIKARKEIKSVKQATNAESLKMGFSHMGVSKTGKAIIVNPKGGPKLAGHNAIWYKHAQAASVADMQAQMLKGIDFGDAITQLADAVTLTSSQVMPERWLSTDAESFIKARSSSKYSRFLSPLQPGDLTQHKLYVTEDGLAGYAVDPDGDVQNVFNNGGPKGEGARAVAHAITESGGRTLDCFSGFLPLLYSQLGFVETGRIDFNEEFAPEGWETDPFLSLKPDVVFMAWQGFGTAGVEGALERATGDRSRWHIPIPVHRTQRFDSFDEAKAHSRGAISAPSSGEVHGSPVDQGARGGGALPGEGDRGVVDPKLTLNQRVYQGSPAKVLIGDAWNDEYIGTGENTQNQGSGHQFSSKKAVADWYRNALAGGEQTYAYSTRLDEMIQAGDVLAVRAVTEAERVFPGSTEAVGLLRNKLNYTKSLIAHNLGRQAIETGTRLKSRQAELFHLEETERAVEFAIKLLQNDEITPVDKPGAVFEAEVPEDEDLMHWDLPVEHQPPKVLAALRSSGLLDRVIEWNTDRILVMPNMNPEIAKKKATDLVMNARAQYLYQDLASLLNVENRWKEQTPWRTLDQRGPNAMASRALREAGIPGHVYTSNSGNRNYLIFDPSKIDFVAKHYQNEVRGWIAFTPGGRRFDITLVDGAEFDTLMHEMAHFFVNVMGDEAQTVGTSEQQKKDYQTLIKWMGYETHEQRLAEMKEAAKLARKQQDETLTPEEEARFVELTDKEEKLAVGLERYLYDGRTPSVELAASFTRMRAWMVKIYGSAKRLGVDLDDEVRGVFDRMLAADDAIAEANAVNPFAPDEQARANMTDAQREQYDAATTKAAVDPQDELRARLMRDQKRVLTEWFKREREQLREEVEYKLSNTPVYRALRFLQTGKMPEGVEMPSSFIGPDGEPMKLDRDSLKRELGGAFMKTAQRMRIYQAEGGLDAQVAAVALGFVSAKEMVDQFAKATPFQQAVEVATEAEIEQRYPDLLKDQAALAQAATLASLSDARAEQLMINIRVLARLAKKEDATTRMPVNNKTMAEAATKQMETRKAGQFSPYSYFQKMTAAGREAVNLKTAALRWDARVKQLWNLHLYRAATKAQAKYEADRKYMQRAGERQFQQKLGKAGKGFLEAANEILARTGFRKESGAAAQRRVDLRAWVADLTANNLDWVIPESILDEAQNKSYREMTLAELGEAADAMRNLEHLSREVNSIVGKNKKRVFMDEMIPALLAQLKATMPIVEPQEHDPNKKIPFGATRVDTKNFYASLLKIEEMIRRMDGGQVNGPWAQMVWNPTVDAQTEERDLTLAVTELLMKEIEKLPEMNKRRLNGTDVYRSKITGKEYTYLFAISVALNNGNEMNAERAANPTRTDPKWGIEAMQEAIEQLTVEDMRFVQGIWDVLETLWPRIAALEERQTGLPQVKVDRKAFSFKGETFQGGYFPLKYARNESQKGRLDSGTATAVLFDHNYARAMTNHGHTQKRVESFGDPVDFSINIIPSHLQSVIHDLTHREAILSINKILNEPDLHFAMLERLGSAKTQQFMDWLRGLANDQNNDVAALTGIAKYTRGARRNLSIYAMGFKATMFFQNFANIISAVDQVKARFLAVGMKEFYENRQEMLGFVKGKSGEMRHRFNAVERDVREMLLGQLTGSKIRRGQAKIARYAGYATSMSDAAVAFPVWLGAYRQGEAEGMSDEDAIAFADRAVRLTQGGSGQKDLANIQRNKEALKWFTMFYTFFSVQFNQLSRITWDTRVSAREKNLAHDFPKLAARTIATIAAQALIAELLSGRGPDEDEPYWKWIIRKAALFPFLTIPIIREGANYAEAKITGRHARDIRFGQIAGIYQESLDALTANYEWIANDNEFDEALIKRDLRAAGMLMGLPLAQPLITGEYIYDLSTGEEDPETVWERARNLMFTRRRK